MRKWQSQIFVKLFPSNGTKPEPRRRMTSLKKQRLQLVQQIADLMKEMLDKGIPAPIALGWIMGILRAGGPEMNKADS